MKIGGDTPGCAKGNPPTNDANGACMDANGGLLPVPVDGKSGTPSKAGLTEENSGVYRKCLRPILLTIYLLLT